MTLREGKELIQSCLNAPENNYPTSDFIANSASNHPQGVPGPKHEPHGMFVYAGVISKIANPSLQDLPNRCRDPRMVSTRILTPTCLAICTEHLVYPRMRILITVTRVHSQPTCLLVRVQSLLFHSVRTADLAFLDSLWLPA